MLKSASEIVKESWSLYINSFKKIWVYLFLLLIPTLALSATGTLSLYLSVYFPSSNLPGEIITFIVFAASFVFTLWVSISFALALRDLAFGREPADWKSNFSASSSLIWPVIYTSILLALIITGGTLLLIIPGLIFIIWYNFTFNAIVFDGKKGGAALSASKSLVVGRWWKMAWRVAAPWLLFGIVAGILSYIFSTITDYVPMSPLISAVVSRVLDSVINVLIIPLTTAATIILYFSAKENPVQP